MLDLSHFFNKSLDSRDWLKIKVYEVILELAHISSYFWFKISTVIKNSTIADGKNPV
jgi:hypothetical protein